MLTMSPFNPLSLLMGLALLVIVAFAAAIVVRVGRARRRAARRVVEQPNSHYVAQLVQEHETRHRWHDIDLSRVHEINRGEVVRLLAKVEAGGTDALRENERTFLDYMAELTRASAPAAAESSRADDAPSAPALRHRSA
jgi:hypothetical protein